MSNLAGVEHLINLESLVLEGSEGGRVADISPLKELKKLQKIVLRNEFISDVSALADMPALKMVDVSGNQLKEASSLAGLKQVTTLDVSANQLTDLRALHHLPVAQKNDGSFRALAQTIIKIDTIETGKETTYSVYLPDGTQLSSSIEQGYGQQNDQVVKWLDKGESTVQFEGLKVENRPYFVAFIKQDVTGQTLEKHQSTKKTDEQEHNIQVFVYVGNFKKDFPLRWFRMFSCLWSNLGSWLCNSNF
ncbi:hypothetical protein CON22_24730 [Bacillus cereus]|nr:hypothetical protein CON22_24730 [Bacillus cereus]